MMSLSCGFRDTRWQQAVAAVRSKRQCRKVMNLSCGSPTYSMAAGGGAPTSDSPRFGLFMLYNYDPPWVLFFS